MDFLTKLRVANDMRREVWPGAEKGDAAFAAIEFAGEAGEVAEAYTDYVICILSNNADAADEAQALQALSDEIGDVFITADLFARSLRINLSAEDIPEYLDSVPEYPITDPGLLVGIAVSVGKTMDATKKLIRAHRGIGGNEKDDIDTHRQKVADCLSVVMVGVHALSRAADINPAQATFTKFNKTSKKLNIPCFMDENGDVTDTFPLTNDA